mmetsp:Transcript_16399/g.23137  ORF Transcript_16399/g.23137 Transcript_16399/m.23137 type:complete len:620 (-) Transcript_16399:96-1955(-)
MVFGNQLLHLGAEVLENESNKRQREEQGNALHALQERNTRQRLGEVQDTVGDISSLLSDIQRRQQQPNYIQEASKLAAFLRNQGQIGVQSQVASIEDVLAQQNSQQPQVQAQALLSGSMPANSQLDLLRQLNGSAANVGLQANLMNMSTLQLAGAGSVQNPMSLLDAASLQAGLGNALAGGAAGNLLVGACLPTPSLQIPNLMDASAVQQQLLNLAGANAGLLLNPSASNLLQKTSDNARLTQRAQGIGDLPQQLLVQNAVQQQTSNVHSAPATAETIPNTTSKQLLPPCDEGQVKRYSERIIMPLSTDEDENWLSEFLCFVRADLVEVFRAGREDVASRINSKKVVHGQVGIRCRFCAHLPHSERASRSSSFPSSLSRIYQSLTMMLRDHFPKCTAMPEAEQAKFIMLKEGKTTQGASGYKRYWLDSAMKLGMVDTPQGIIITERSQAVGTSVPPFGTSNNIPAVASISLFGQQDLTTCLSPEQLENGSPFLLIEEDDKQLVSEYLFVLMSQVQRVFLTESERVGNRKTLEVGLPGIACRHCCRTNRKGLCRLFPARRRSLPGKIKDLHNHLRRCTLCPSDVKETLMKLKDESKDTENLKTFLNRVWARLYSGKSSKP